jgi:hypothetical protein
MSKDQIKVRKYDESIIQLGKKYKIRQTEKKKTMLEMHNYFQEETKSARENLKKAWDEYQNKIKELSETQNYKVLHQKLKSNDDTDKKVQRFFQSEYEKIIKSKQLTEKEKEEELLQLQEFMQETFDIVPCTGIVIYYR